MCFFRPDDHIFCSFLCGFLSVFIFFLCPNCRVWSLDLSDICT